MTTPAKPSPNATLCLWCKRHVPVEITLLKEEVSQDLCHTPTPRQSSRSGFTPFFGAPTVTVLLAEKTTLVHIHEQRTWKREHPNHFGNEVPNAFHANCTAPEKRFLENSPTESVLKTFIFHQFWETIRSTTDINTSSWHRGPSSIETNTTKSHFSNAFSSRYCTTWAGLREAEQGIAQTPHGYEIYF